MLCVKRGRVHVQNLCHPTKNGDGRVAFAALDTAKMAHREPRFAGERFLA